MTRKVIRILVAIVLIGAVLTVGGRMFAYNKIKQVIRAQADSLRSKGFTVSFDSLHANSWTSRVDVSHVSIISPGKSCTDTVSRFTADKIEIKGISLLTALLKKELKVSMVTVSKPFLRNDGRPRTHHDKPKKDLKISLISIEKIELLSARYELGDTGYCKTKQRGQFTLRINNLRVDKPGSDKQKLIIADMNIDSGRIELPFSFYTVSFQKLQYSSNSQSLKVDSFKIKPWYDKLTFVRKTGVQTDRVDLTVPSLDIAGVSSILSGSDTLFSKEISFAFTADIFRDKRQPGGKPKVKKLISGLIHAIPYPIQIDSILVLPSEIQYEEFQAEGNRSGTVTFNKLQASIGNFSTISPSDMTMKAKAKFMDAGDLSAYFTFPSDPAKAYTIRGSLSNFNMTKLNSILIPAGNVEIKKGHLNTMAFNYEYNEYRSDGKLTMDYDDLDVVSLLKNSDQKAENKIVTLILKSFVVKKDIDRTKSGTILFYRDQGKATFNYWWKSILSGVKSLYNLDKIVDTHHSKKK